MAVSMNLSLTLDGVTYGELYEFVDAVRAAGVPADEKVRCVGSDDKGDRFEVDLGGGHRRPGAGTKVASVVGVTPAAGRSVPVDGPTGSVGDAVRSMVREEDLDRVVATLREMRRFLK